MIELKLIKEFPCELIALDEVGRAPLAGPVVIGAVRVLLPDQESLVKLMKFLKPKGIKDSKKLTSQGRQEVLKKLKIPQLPYREKGVIDCKGIALSFITWEMDLDAILTDNILGASLRGMKEAGLALSDAEKGMTTALIDGHLKLRWDNKESPWNEITIIKGDSKSKLIGLASIIAKEKRDSWMRDMHEIYPQYGFDSHVGYPTPSHRKAIKKFGPCPIHRAAFGTVKKVMEAKVRADKRKARVNQISQLNDSSSGITPSSP